MNFYKYHALGNDYIVLRAEDGADRLQPEQIERICHRHFGVGSDGILVYFPKDEDGSFPFRGFNPDGSEFEKSGNGLRIFSRFLYDQGFVSEEPFKIRTIAGPVESTVSDQGRSVSIEMGEVSFQSEIIPVAGESREVVQETIQAKEKSFVFTAANIGNPHCVIPTTGLSADMAKTYGPDLEVHPMFPNRTNVQFMEVLDRNAIRIEIWERGAGYTLASGSSSSASAAVAKKLGLCDSDITVHMPGGVLSIHVDDSFAVRMAGDVTRVGDGQFYPEMMEWTLGGG